jgi:hypothetical protein
MRNYSVSQIFFKEKMWRSLNPIAIGSQCAAVIKRQTPFAENYLSAA